jgi:uncharacterized protein YfaS (alpha-2-macroglobulin family)
MISSLRHSIVLIGCLLLCACHSKNELQVTATNFQSEVEQQQNLIFSFNKDIVPDSLVNVWDSTQYIEFEPAVRGRFMWNSTSQLSFSPENGFAPCTEYTARATELVLRYSKKSYSISAEPVYFHTAPLKITSTHLSWVRGKNVANVMVQLDMGFNYDVDLSTALSKLKLTSRDKQVNVSAVNAGTGKVLSLQFVPLNDKDETTPLNIDIAKGISVGGTKKISEHDTTIATDIPSRYNLSVTDVISQHTGTDGMITVTTSQPLISADLKSMITIEPTVPFDITINESGFTLTGSKFVPKQIYELVISSSLEGEYGGKMKSLYRTQVQFGKLKPSISFANSKGMYLSGNGYKNIALNIVNVPAVAVTITKVYENNLEQFMRGDKDWNYHWDREEQEGLSYQYYNTTNLGDEIFSKTYETSKLPHQNAASILTLDFQDKIKEYNGIYVLQVKSKEHNWLQDSKIISISDIGLIVKEENDNMYVFANSIRNATALQNVSISFVSTNNQKLYTATTDNEGVVVFRNISKNSPGFKVGLVTAKMNSEFSFVWLDKTLIGTSRFDVGGRSPNATNLNAMIYPERNLYRPGETISLSSIVRDEQWNVVSDVPIKIKLVMPNGREFATQRKILNDQGSCEATFTPPNTAMTGSYIVQVFTGNDVLLNTYTISVEEFMPDRMKANLSLSKAEFKPGENINATIQADNLFGTPAANRNYQCELEIEKTAFRSPKFTDYDFSMHNEFRFSTDHRDGKTDEKGTSSQSFTLANDLVNNGLLKGTVSATVFDETGRPVHRYAQFSVHTQPVYIGIKRGDEYVSSRNPIKIPLVAIDKNSAHQAVNAQVVFVRKEWHTVLEQDGNSYKYVSKSDDIIVSNQKLRISGNTGYCIVTPTQSGQYEVRVFVNGANNYVSRQFYAYGWGDTEYSSFEVDNEGNVEIKTDKETYALGDNVNILFTTPFDGRMLVTLERNQVVKYYYVEAKNKSASLSFKADEVLIPNVYVTAALFRPMDGSDLPLAVAHGFQSVSVENKNNHLPVKITVTDRSRSKTKQTINVKTQPGAYVTIAAADEGILQIKNFSTPNAYDYFYTKMALGVNTYDIYPWLLPEIRTTLSSTGGDGDDGSGARVNPMFVNRVKNVSYWSGIRQADASGNVRYDIDIPQFSGDIRVMALAYKDKAFGDADAHMKVADPIIISTALPRFLSPKDEVIMPVSLSNTTAKEATAVVVVKVTGPLSVSGEYTSTIKIPANREQRTVFNIKAQPAIGAGNVIVTVKAFNETFLNETDISVRPPASLQKITGSGFAAENTTTPLDFKNNLIPTSMRGKLVVGRSPLTQFSKNLDDLVRYPYGCVEQTTSAVFPQLYYADLVKSISGTSGFNVNAAYNIQQAINKLQSMQVGNGALTYWPGGDYESWWGSVYACHFLLEARKAGYDVNSGTIDRLIDYMKYKLVKKEVETYWYNGTLRKDIAPHEVPYSLFILAVAGHSQQSAMNYYKAHIELLSLDGRYLLSAAYALSGQPVQAREVLPAAFSGEVANQAFGGSFYSYIRDLSISLNVLIDVDPKNKQIGTLARQLSEQLKKERYLNTQENVFSILALGKLAREANKATSTAMVTSGGKNVSSSTGNLLSVDLKPLANTAMALKVNGKGGFYYFWEVSGITADGSFKEEDSYLRVRRTFFTREGHEVSNNTFHQNDLIVVRISVEAQHDVTIDNVAVTDMLPAGFEIENSRLNNMPALKWVKEVADAERKKDRNDDDDEDDEDNSPAKYKQPFDYADIRDDRINFFTSVGQKRKNFYYMVRAVSPGVYQLGPVQADAMYDGSYHSYSGGGIVRVTEK